MRSVLLTLLCLAPSLSFAQSAPASQRYASLTESLQSSRKSKDWPAYLQSALQFRDFLNSSPNSLIPLARAYSLNHNLPAAFDAFRQFVAMGQVSDEFLNSPDFEALRQNPQFGPIAAAMRSNQSSVSLSTTFITLDTLAGQITEDLDTENAKSFFFTTVLGKKLFVATPDSRVREFATPPTDLPLLAIKLDSPRGLLWASAVGLSDFAGVKPSAVGTSVLLCYSVATGKLIRQIDGPRKSALGDFTISKSGDLFLADNSGALYRLAHDSSTLERLDHGEFISPQTPALSSDEALLFIPDYLRGIAVLDLHSGALRWLDSQSKFALAGIDGLYFYEGKLIAVQNGSSPERVVLFSLDSTLSRISSETVIERSTPTLGDPTHGVIRDRAFFYIANSGWDTLDDHGKLNPGAHLSSPHIMRFPLP